MQLPLIPLPIEHS